MELYISVLPIFLIGCFVYFNDRDKESLFLLFKLLFFGIISCFPSTTVELFLQRFFVVEGNNNFFNLLISVFISIAFVEEFFKYIMTYIISYNHKDFCNLYDMIVYATFVSLGFALFENILYVLENGVMIGFLRALFSVPGHACFGIIMGYYLGLSKIALINNNNSLYKKNLIMGLLIPTLMHTFFDFCLFNGSIFLVILFLFYVIYIYVFCIKKVGYISKNVSDFISK